MSECTIRLPQVQRGEPNGGRTLDDFCQRSQRFARSAQAAGPRRGAKHPLKYCFERRFIKSVEPVFRPNAR
jgi:hypothetical protein